MAEQTQLNSPTRPPQRRGHKLGSASSKTLELAERAKILWDNGSDVKEIADKLSCSLGTVYSYLKKDGKWRSRRDLSISELRQRHRAWLQRLLKIRSLSRLGYSRSEVGAMLNPPVSAESVDHILKVVREYFGDKSMSPKTVSLYDAQRATSINRDTIKCWCNNGWLVNHIELKTGRLVLTAQGLAELVWLAGPEAAINCANPECNTRFTPTANFGRRFCSRVCYRRGHYLKRQSSGKFLNPGETNHRPGTFQELLVESLLEHQLPSDEEWISLSRAAKLTGLTPTKLIWLVRTKVLSSKKDPRKLWQNKRPVALYATSELRIVRSVYETWLAKNPPRS